MRLVGRTAVVTGAASGIGRATAIAFAGRGSHLALCDIDAAGLNGTAALAAAAGGVRISRHRFDLADPLAVRALPSAILASHPNVDVLVNNAGVALGGTFEQVGDDDLEWLFQINFWGVTRMTRALLPMLRRSDDARIVNISSLFGLVAPAGQAGYAASKFAIRGFSLALAAELSGSSVGITLVHPGGVATGIAANARMAASLSDGDASRVRSAFFRFLTLAPARAAEAIVRAVEQRRSRIIIGRDARVIATLERLLPIRHVRVLDWIGLAS